MTPITEGRNSGAKDQLEKISLKAKSSAQAVKEEMRSVILAVEERIAVDDHVNNMSQEMEYLLDSIDSIPRDSQKKILLAFKNFLKENLQAVDSRLASLS
jgi:hypothetical protein